MKQAIATYFLLFTLGIFAHSTQQVAYHPPNKVTGMLSVASFNKDASPVITPGSAYNTFVRAAKKSGIPHRKFENLKDISEGYYIVSGVFSSKQNAIKSVNSLRKKGFSPNYISLPEKHLNYVYLEFHKEGQNAIDACLSRLNGRFKEDVWIIAVEHSTAMEMGDIKRTPTARKTKDILKKVAVSDRQPEADYFLKAARDNEIPTRTFRKLTGVNNGFYIIAGVYSNIENAKKLLRKYQSQGFGAGLITVPTNGLNYLYLAYHQSGQSAIDACLVPPNSTRKDSVWIMKVEESIPIQQKITPEKPNWPSRQVLRKDAIAVKDPIPLDAITYDLLEASRQPSAQQTLPDARHKNTLIERADSYFNKMWYAEAAELYEDALDQSQNNLSFDILLKAADAHYYNSNLEKAYQWYNILFEQYSEEMSAENIFRYAHALKATGNYARAKKLMRLYNKKMSVGDTDKAISPMNLRNEVVLDNILKSTHNFEIKNMAVNSIYSDFSPMFLDKEHVVFASAKDSSYFNTRRYKWNDQPYLDLYVAKVNEESDELKNAIKFSKNINTKYHEASVTFSPDNTTMYFTRNNYGKKLKRDKKGINNLKIYVSHKVNGEWTKANEVGFNSDNYSTGHPALSPDGKKLYFVSDMPGSIGATDIFVVDVLDNGRFSEPKNLGPGINTESKEMFPFITDKKLYFSSNGHTGLGGLDIFEAALDEAGGFEMAINVGQPVNSKKDDFSYIVNEENQKGFFASNRAGGKGDDDIYSFKRLVVEEVAENLNAIAGVVTEMVTGDLLPNALVELLDENGIKIKEMVTEDDGNFVFEDLKDNTKYILKTTKDEYFDAESQVATKANEAINVDISLKRLEEMIAIEDGIKKLKTEMIYFDFDKSNIRDDAASELQKLVEVMAEYPNMVIKIESHTDSRGNAAYNKYLSDKRAKSTRAYIISQGIEASRIESATGFGEERLVNSCDGTIRCTEQEHYRNRRSEFIIVNM
tara:strand:+ start:25008 stop:27962 length:2955 start_codon:yes stop_codon:yes gene_type:complete